MGCHLEADGLAPHDILEESSTKRHGVGYCPLPGLLVSLGIRMSSGLQTEGGKSATQNSVVKLFMIEEGDDVGVEL